MFTASPTLVLKPCPPHGGFTCAASPTRYTRPQANVNPPWGGHGFNTSVGDAVNIAWKLAAVERGWAAADLLASYEAERRGIVGQTVASAEANMRALAGDLAADAAAIQRAKRPEFYSLGLVLGYSYAGSPVIQPASGPDPGDTTSYIPAADPGARL